MKALRYGGCVVLVAFFLLQGGCDCPQAAISTMNPVSGQGGTIVEVVYTGGGLSGTIIFDGTSVETRSAGNLGLGNRLRFTVPYDATTGNKNVVVSSLGGNSGPMVFNVTGTGVVPNPVIDGFEIAGAEGKEITVFGTGFSTYSEVFIDGTEVQRYGGNSLPLREIPFDMVDNVIICTPATDLAQGSSYTVQVRNPGGINSANFNISVPSRVCNVEFDAITGEALPDYYINWNGTINTIRRSYTECGWIIELEYDDTSVVDPFPGRTFSNADLYSFWQANATGAAGNYMHGSFLTSRDVGSLGVMFMSTGSVSTLPASERRQGFAVFSDAFDGMAQRAARYLRTTMHEAGHGFNLLHSDNSGNSTVMTQTGDLVAGWTHTFSNTSCTHLTSHTLNAVRPGGEAFGSGRSCNSLH